MQNSRPNPIVRLLPSLTDVVFLMPIVFLFTRLEGIRHMLSDGDTGWHVRTGEWMLATGQIPRRDIFSFTKPGEPWFAWEWLWDLCFGWLHQHFGMAAVVIPSLCVIALTFALLFRLARRKCRNVLIAGGLTIGAAAASSMHWLARPHLFSMLFAVLFYSVLERARQGNRRWLLWLPPLTALWVNVHAGFFIGILFLLAYAGGELADALLNPDHVARRAALANSKPYLLAIGGCIAASFANPYTYHLHVYIYKFLSEAYAFRYINEYQSINFHHPLAIYFEPAVLLALCAAMWTLYQRRFGYTLLILGWTHLALVSMRNIPIFLIALTPVLASCIDDWLALVQGLKVADWLKRSVAAINDLGNEIGEVDRIGRVHLVSMAAVVLITAICYAPAPPEKFRATYDPKKYPEKALGVLRGAERARSIFADDEWGDFLIYRLYPNTKVFVDGRADFYGSKFNEKYIDVMNVKYDWEKNLNRYAIDTILLPPDAALAGALKESSRWRVIYDDGIAIVFRAARTREGEQFSAAEKGSGTTGGCKVANSELRDLRDTKSQPRSEYHYVAKLH
jgi:hypothetical protein